MTMFAEIKLQETMPQTRAQGQAEQLKHQQDKIDQQNTTIEKLELKIQTLELTKGGGAGGGAGGGKRKSPDTEYQAAGGGAGFVHDDAGAGNWLKHDTYPDTYIV